jgi:hypothetical protein
MLRPLRRALLVVAVALAVVGPLGAQVRPDDHWRTLRTEHFRVHFALGLEALARRTAANAELAWAQLARELHPPETPVDIVVADYADFANGFATSFPSNRIVVFARPPVEDLQLRNHADWNALLVTHELAHVFHLDRARGWWALARDVFGRAAPFFPNAYAPAWVIEGLAVHYETRLAGGGRLAGTEFPMLVRAAAQEGRLPRLDALSLGAPHFPGGSVAYVYGAYLMDRAAPGAMRRFVDTQSGRLLPWRQDANAREAFGETFTHGFARWRDSVRLAATGVAAPDDSATRTLTTHRWSARLPRWISDDSLIYAADDQRQTPGAYLLTLGGERRRLGRRNSLDANAPGRLLSTLQAELDRTDPYSVLSDLYVSRGRARDRITRGARLTAPDLHRPSGRIVAVRSVPGSTSLVTMRDTADPPREIARGSLDVTWSEPRWSGSGRLIAAARWERGGHTAIVVMDERGGAVRTFAPRGRALSITSSPAWVPGDTMLVFVSDHEGRAEVYLGDVRTGAYGRIWTSATGLMSPDVSPDGKRIAAVETRGGGTHVVMREMPAVELALPPLDTLAPARPASAPLVDAVTPVERYAAWRTLIPTWWLPVVGESDQGTRRLGGFTSMSDVLGRHTYHASYARDLRFRENILELAYSWAGLGNPVFSAGYEQDWIHAGIYQGPDDRVGTLAQRTRTATLSALVRRPGVRFSGYAVVGAEVDLVDYAAYPVDSLKYFLGPEAYGRLETFPTLVTAVGASTMQRPGLSVSVEDGAAVQYTFRRRFRGGLQYEDLLESITVGQAAKSLPFPGFARHVVAVRGAYGHGDHRTTSAFTAGGNSGASIELLPGLAFGDSRRDFFARGFEAGAQFGVRAAAASVEYRAPLVLIGRGVRLLPTYAQKASLVAFADGAMAWCDGPVQDSFICRDPVPPRTLMGSVGAELALDGSLQYDVIYRFRFGVARPVRGTEYAARPTTFYLSLGGAF